MLQDAMRRTRRRRRAPGTRPTRAVAYLRVSTQEQADSRAGIDAQRTALTAELTRRGWLDDATWVEDAGFSAKDLSRPGIQRALAMLNAGEADVLMVAKLDRLSRSLLDFASLMDRAQREGWAVVALDLGVDTSTPAGEMMSAVLAAFSQYERRLISQRTRDALAAKQAQGVRVGRPRALDPAVRARLAKMRSAGMTYTAIAERLNSEGVPTAHGGAQWYPATVRGALKS